MAGNANRRLGFGFEREVKKVLIEAGYEAERMWGSDGRSRGLDKEVDIIWQRGDRTITLQAKRKKVLPKYLKTGAVDATVFREDRGDTYVLIPLNTLIKLLKESDE